MGSVKKAFKNIVKSPAKVVSSIAKGDISGAIGGAANAISFGTVGSGGVLVDTEKVMPSATTLKAKEQAEKHAMQASQVAEEQAQKAAKLEEAEEKRRKTIFFTSGQELGENIGLVGNLKRRGSILGN